GGRGGLLADRGGGGAAPAAREGGDAGVAGGRRLDRLPPPGPAPDPPRHALLRPAPLLRRLPLPAPIIRLGRPRPAVAGGGLHAAPLRDPGRRRPRPGAPAREQAISGCRVVVLDLDETLVSAYESSGLPPIVRTQAVEAGLHCFDMECISTDKDVEGKQKVNHVTVFERPGLHEFLQKTSEFADLILFTAGLEGYARPLVDIIDAHNRFKLRLYRPSTVTTEYREHVKDLSCLSKDFSRIVIVDNNPFSFIVQPLNGIPCVPFSAGQHSDDQLMEVIFPLLKHLSVQRDVRPALYERFHMPEWFQKHGIPRTDQAL
uniref:FCP1 homology domain-containing protein n=3 Tax=Aegilops tauschii subsp. strangulata TaxID=200361 RepID=A0A453FV74_AEGTS